MKLRRLTIKSIPGALLFLVCLIYLTSSCAKEKSGPEFIRLVDHLGEGNIIFSPLAALENKFERIKQEWSGQDLAEFKYNQKKCWAVSTRFPLLGTDETKKPEEMTVLRDGNEIEFSQDVRSQTVTWRYLKGESDILPRKIYPAKRRDEGIVLQEDEFLESEIVLPRGKVVFDVFAACESSGDSSIQMSVFLDGHKISTLSVKDYKSYRLIGETSLGRHSLKLTIESSGPDSKYNSKMLYVDRIKIKALRDILLILPPAGEEGKPVGAFEAAYYHEPVDTIMGPDPSSEFKQDFSAEVTFASPGKKQIEIIGKPMHVPSTLSLWLGDRKIGTKEISDLEWNSHIFEAFISEGSHTLKAQGEMALHGIIVENPLKNTLLPLYKLRKGAELLDQGIGENPFVLKKKFVITQNAYGRSFNTVFAPPRSIFEYELEIPVKPVLEFGYGLLDPAWKDPGDGVNFIVRIDNGVENKVVFSRYLDPYQNEKQRRIFQKKVDLSDYQGQKVKLSLVTEGFPPGDKSLRRHPDMRNDLSYWFNPVLYECSEEEMNIILISIDTLRADHLHCYGYDRETSPNIDQLAQDSVQFLNTFSDSPWTLPAHVSLFTSLFTINHGVNSLQNKLPSSLVTLADILRQNGYSCSAFTGGGKVSAKFGFSKGFDFYGESKVVFYQQNAVEQLFKRATRWIDQNRDKPFFLFLHTYQVHGPYNPPAPYDQIFSTQKIDDNEAFLKKVLGRVGDKYRPMKDTDREEIVSLYDGEIRYMDEHLIKPLIKQLRESNLYDRTMIVFTSDHGEEFYDHQGWEHSHSLYNELIKVPLIIKFPNSQYKGMRVDSSVRLIDIAPSILDASGLRSFKLGTDGQSLLRIIHGKEKGNRTFVSYLGPDGFRHTPEKISMNDNEYKLILNGRYSEKALSFFKPPPPSLERLELYHLVQDPMERKNLFNQRPETTQKLLKELEKRLKRSHKAKAQEKSIIDEELEERLRALGYIK
ncbi:sulfatase [Acidobacteriota bacterium]